MINDDEIFTINLRFAGQIFPLRIKRKDEGKFRRAAKFIDEIVQKYQSNFSHHGPKDWMGMALVEITVSLIEKMDDNSVEEINEELRDLTVILDNFAQEL